MVGGVLEYKMYHVPTRMTQLFMPGIALVVVDSYKAAVLLLVRQHRTTI